MSCLLRRSLILMGVLLAFQFSRTSRADEKARKPASVDGQWTSPSHSMNLTINADGSASIEQSCGTITIGAGQWNMSGEPINGTASSSLLGGGKAVVVTATINRNGLQVKFSDEEGVNTFVKGTTHFMHCG